jgi:hypothetical protein
MAAVIRHKGRTHETLVGARALDELPTDPLNG